MSLDRPVVAWPLAPTTHRLRLLAQVSQGEITARHEGDVLASRDALGVRVTDRCAEMESAGWIEQGLMVERRIVWAITATGERILNTRRRST